MSSDGGPAFPGEPKRYRVDTKTGAVDMFGHCGMSMRDYFAAKAMAAIISAITTEDDIGIIHNAPRAISEIAYTYADTMLEERAKAAQPSPASSSP